MKFKPRHRVRGYYYLTFAWWPVYCWDIKKMVWFEYTWTRKSAEWFEDQRGTGEWTFWDHRYHMPVNDWKAYWGETPTKNDDLKGEVV